MLQCGENHSFMRWVEGNLKLLPIIQGQKSTFLWRSAVRVGLRMSLCFYFLFFFPVVLRRALVKDMPFCRVCFCLTWWICYFFVQELTERRPWSKVPLVSRRMSSLGIGLCESVLVRHLLGEAGEGCWMLCCRQCPAEQFCTLIPWDADNRTRALLPESPQSTPANLLVFYARWIITLVLLDWFGFVFFSVLICYLMYCWIINRIRK